MGGRRIGWAASFAMAGVFVSLAAIPARSSGIAFVPFDADSVDGFDVSREPKPGYLLPLDFDGRFPASVISQGPGSRLDADTLDGKQLTEILEMAAGGKVLDLDCDACVGTRDLASGSITPDRIADGAVTTGKIRPGAVTADRLAFDPATGDDLDAHRLSADHDLRYPTRYELLGPGSVNDDANPVDWGRLKGVPEGLADGVDAMERPGFVRAVVDSDGDVGGQTAMAIGVDGLPVVAYRDETREALKIAHCNDLACRKRTVSVLDARASLPSITIGADGLALVAYRDDTDSFLKVAHCANVRCTSSVKAKLHLTGSTALTTSITVGVDGLGLISMLHSVAPDDLLVAHCEDVYCSRATVTTIDREDWSAFASAITIGADGLGLVSFDDYTKRDLKVAHCENVACTSARVTTLDASGDVGASSSVTLAADGRGIVAYQDATNGTLKVAHCRDLACTSASFAAVAPGLGEYPSMTVGADGMPLVAIPSAGGLAVVRCSDPGCASATTAIVDPVAASRPSLAIGSDGLPILAYYDAGAGDLKVTHCSNVFCLPYHRQR